MHLPLRQFLRPFVRSASRLSARALFPLLLVTGLLTSATLTAQTFGNVAMGGGGFVSGLITSKSQPNLLYARTDVGGAYRFDAAVGRWIPLIDWASSGETGYLGVDSLAIDPRNANNLFLLVGISYFNNGRTAILRSTDQGNTFTVTDVSAIFKTHGNGMGRQSGERLVVDPNIGTTLLCGTRFNGLFKSTDSGANWTRLNALNVTTTPNGNGINLVVFDPSSGSTGSATQTVVVGVSQFGTNLFRSNDGGATFTAIPGAPTSLMPQRAALTADHNLIITFANGAGPFGTTAEPVNAGAIWKYNIQTGAWTDLTPAGNALPFSGISIDPTNANRLVASTVNIFRSQGSAFGDQFFLSTNGGTSWTNVVARGFSIDPNGVTWMTSAQSIHWAGCIEFDPFNSKRVFVISGNGTFVTDNIDATPTVWKFNVRGIEESVPLDLVSVPGGPVISVIGDFDGFVNTNVTQYGPQHTPRIGSTSGLAVAALNPSKVVRAGSAMYISNDTAASWTRTAKINGSQGHVALSANGNTLLHSPNGSSTTFRSVDNGSTWTSVGGINFSNARMVADQVNSNKFFAYNTGSGAFLVSTDAGVSFAQSATLPSAGSRHIRTVPGFEGHIWVALYGGGLRRSTNSGQAFSTLSNVSACSAVGLGKAGPGATYPTVFIWGTVGGVEGIYRSTDQGATWTRINDNAHEWGGPGNGQFVVGDANIFGRVYMSTAGRGAVYIDSGGAVVPVAVTGVTVSPAAVSVVAGATTQLTATVAPVNATNPAVTWSTSNASVATVNSSGLVTAVAAGAATITARTQDGGFTSSSALTVASINIPVTGVSVSPTTVSVAAGSTTALSALVAPANATNKTVTWSSSAPAIATVSSAGVVTGVAAGNATITVTAQGGFSATAVVTVTSGSTGGPTCTGGTAIAFPFAQNGAGDLCFIASGNVAFINSWNMQLVEVNGVNFTNKWANSLPPRINGNYYIHYVANVPWAHFEITGQ